jgi:hypothetical protein
VVAWLVCIFLASSFLVVTFFLLGLLSLELFVQPRDSVNDGMDCGVGVIFSALACALLATLAIHLPQGKKVWSSSPDARAYKHRDETAYFDVHVSDFVAS